ncbi:MAG TPA: MFS transporter [Acidimicrobiales bacterium]|nr:MFS transporter [Acidimicrobiales bacterium]
MEGQDLSQLRLHRWSDREIVAVALAALAIGFGQFGVVAALGDVAKGFGQVSNGATIADQAGLSGTVLGVGLAIIRLASLGGLPVAGLADHFGRRRTLIATLVAGLVVTALAAASPSYWWFVAIFAVGRPLLSGADAVAQVTAAEQTGQADRTKAVALVAAGYGVGAGIAAVLHSIGLGAIGFRGLFALALLPVIVLAPLRHWLSEPDRFNVAAATDRPLPVLGAVAPRFRRRLAVVAGLSFALSVITGPANSFVFLYAQDIVHQSGYVTAAMVVGAGASGLLGLVLGQWLADRIGRRVTATIGMVGISVFGVLAYTGSGSALALGYIIGVLFGSLLAPAAGAMINELFPTSVRASVAGWWVAAGVAGAATGLIVFGTVADIRNQFTLAAAVTFLPAAVAAVLFWLLPETRGREPEEVSG